MLAFISLVALTDFPNGWPNKSMNLETITKAKSFGFSDKQIANLAGKSEQEIREFRRQNDLLPSYRLVDTCAAEFEAYTPYYYSSYDRGDDEIRASETRKVMILGGGPNRIGQGIEFDYCCVHASFALKETGIETIMVNSNPETVSTDYDTSDKLFFEPLTLEDVLNIYHRENPIVLISDLFLLFRGNIACHFLGDGAAPRYKTKAWKE